MTITTHWTVALEDDTRIEFDTLVPEGDERVDVPRSEAVGVAEAISIIAQRLSSPFAWVRRETREITNGTQEVARERLRCESICGGIAFDRNESARAAGDTDEGRRLLHERDGAEACKTAIRAAILVLTQPEDEGAASWAVTQEVREYLAQHEHEGNRALSLLRRTADALDALPVPPAPLCPTCRTGSRAGCCYPDTLTTAVSHVPVEAVASLEVIYDEDTGTWCVRHAGGPGILAEFHDASTGEVDARTFAAIRIRRGTRPVPFATIDGKPVAAEDCTGGPLDDPEAIYASEHS